MKESLIAPLLVEVRPSKILNLFGKPIGYGVFAIKDIPKGEILEECYYLIMHRSYQDMDKAMKNYVFMCGHKHSTDTSKPIEHMAACVLGNAMIYNHNSSRYNVEYMIDTENKIFTYYTGKDVFKDEELFVSYGDNSSVVHKINQGTA